MGGLMEGGKNVQESESSTRIDPFLAQKSKQYLQQLEPFFNMGPQAFNYRGPSVAAFNPTQMAAMDAQAGASNAFGIPTVSAASSLPTPNYTDEMGLTGYNVFPLMQAGMSDEYRRMYNRMWGPNGQISNPKRPARPVVTGTRRESGPKKRITRKFGKMGYIRPWEEGYDDHYYYKGRR